MYFIVGKTINQNKQVISYLITDGNSVRGVTPQQVYIEYQKGSLQYMGYTVWHCFSIVWLYNSILLQ